jgi:hypothetical protein
MSRYCMLRFFGQHAYVSSGREPGAPWRRPKRQLLPSESLNHFNVQHSEANILDCVAHLPQDCVETMIELGWDRST